MDLKNIPGGIRGAAFGYLLHCLYGGGEGALCLKDWMEANVLYSLFVFFLIMLLVFAFSVILVDC